jgi:hypothetical protein
MQGLGSVSPLAIEPGHTPQFLTPALSRFITLSRVLNKYGKAYGTGIHLRCWAIGRRTTSLLSTPDRFYELSGVGEGAG